MLRLGFTAFGGPAVHLVMLRKETVERRRWLTEQQFLDLVGASGLIPGPSSTETAIHLGMVRAGVPGLWTAGLCFISPAVLITLLVAVLYDRFGALPVSQGMLFGVKPAVLALMGLAIAMLGKSALKSPPLRILGGAALLAYVLHLPELAVLLACGALAVLQAGPWRTPPVSLAALLWLGLPVAGTASVLAAPATTRNIFLYFLKIGASLFGSGYVLFAFLQHGLVHDLHWLSERQLLDAVAVGQFTPGPVFSTATFVGYVVGRHSGAGGTAGALAASLGIFMPSFLLVWATHPIVRKLRGSPWSGAFLDGINVGSVVLMAGVLLRLAGPALPDWRSAVILVASLVAVFRFQLNGAWVVLGSAVAGVLLRLL